MRGVLPFCYVLRVRMTCISRPDVLEYRKLNRTLQRLGARRFSGRVKRESGVNPERYRHCVWERLSKAHWPPAGKRESGDEQSQETCPGVGS